MFWRRYVPVAQRRRQAAKKVAALKKAGRKLEPVAIEGRKIATTFWGQAWCDNLEAYSDYENRLPRGRTYVRNGSVIDLRVEAGRVRALVSGSDIYEVEVAIGSLAASRWKEVKRRCGGQIGSLVELLAGSLSKGVMQVVTDRAHGLFPAPREIQVQCSCPDWASMCKHVAAVLYGVGARLDHHPELLFTLRGVDPAEMVEAAVLPQTVSRGKGRVLESGDLSSVFGIDIEVASSAPKAPAPTRARPAKKALTVEEQTLHSVQREGQITTGAAMQRFGLPRARAKAMLERMAERGALRRVGQRGRGVHYVLGPG